MTEQNLDDADFGAAFQEMGGKAVAQRMHPQIRAERQAECTTWTLMGLLPSRPGKKPDLRSHQLPIDPAGCSNCADSLTLLSLPPLPCSTRMTSRSPSILLTLRLTVSEVRNRAA